ncbi:uncharacterized protein M421DRAFT_426539 [Didymella exigua CBS 183.55]|uniref:Uncharacterized protein n=1 Tax=Didymella exigua CBS 183.55 TaxID=1150837 RepID=A0A6A5R6H8_9PLEO|nr:uncharacterized protein M421DRAFT_426539 [Didymella exigua CBS 183.55]KAF1922798.1 hypothetical protein M421DRAFT_426539 [Didymella exigua CBS 183.55]
MGADVDQLTAQQSRDFCPSNQTSQFKSSATTLTAHHLCRYPCEESPPRSPTMRKSPQQLTNRLPSTGRRGNAGRHWLSAPLLAQPHHHTAHWIRAFPPLSRHPIRAPGALVSIPRVQGSRRYALSSRAIRCSAALTAGLERAKDR